MSDDRTRHSPTTRATPARSAIGSAVMLLVVSALLAAPASAVVIEDASRLHGSRLQQRNDAQPRRLPQALADAVKQLTQQCLRVVSAPMPVSPVSVDADVSRVVGIHALDTQRLEELRRLDLPPPGVS